MRSRGFAEKEKANTGRRGEEKNGRIVEGGDERPELGRVGRRTETFEPVLLKEEELSPERARG